MLHTRVKEAIHVRLHLTNINCIQLVSVTNHGNLHLERFPFGDAAHFESPDDFLSVFNCFPEDRKIHTYQPELKGYKGISSWSTASISLARASSPKKLNCPRNNLTINVSFELQ